jgi:hypothetical protein
MPDIEVKTADSERKSCLSRKRDANPLPSFVLMTSSSDLP